MLLISRSAWLSGFVLASIFFLCVSFSCSPKELFSPARLHELTAKVSNLELLLEVESQQKNEAVKKVDALGERVRELEMQLESEAQQSHEALEKIQSSEERAEELETQPQSETGDKIHSAERRVAELEMQLESEAQQKHEATKEAELLALRVADLERRLNDQSHVHDGADKQVQSDCLALGSSSVF